MNNGLSNAFCDNLQVWDTVSTGFRCEYICIGIIDMIYGDVYVQNCCLSMSTVYICGSDFGDYMCDMYCMAARQLESVACPVCIGGCGECSDVGRTEVCR
ncbi:hypothetical protein GDO86_006326 [Hymenochirus boettgeri]|uniref:Uncharacterized protein n=1 Tax=Hymenochirus boettgeri TaxID=247094 RepID=A0A8T2JAE0_9PIPI|nr:hypothetical protein GDO86_006326 [Hymenochirus boettgeri]